MNTVKLLLASTNLGKLREFREAARARGISVEPLPEFENLPPCREDGRTFEENARRKALHYSRLKAGLIFADDSGLCVDALGGAPGVHSARYAGRAATDTANNEKLLQELRFRRADLQVRRTSRATERAAHYVCVIVLAEGDKVLTVTEGRADGIILKEPRGTGGFGYDPLFFYPPLGKTFAELSPEEKAAVSHRGAAFGKVIEYVARVGGG